MVEDSKLMPNLIERISGLLAKATAAPWQPCYHLEKPENDAACPCKTRGIIYGSDGEHAVCEMGSTSIPGQEGMEPPRYDRSVELMNAALIFEIRNAAPALMDALKEAKAFLEAWDQCDDYLGVYDFALRDPIRALRSKLVALDGGE